MQEALEEHGGLLVADAQAAEVLKPRDRAFHGPASLVPPQRAAILRGVLGLAALAVRGDHLNALRVEIFIQRVAVVGLVADDALRRVTGEAGGPITDNSRTLNVPPSSDALGG